MRCLFSMSEVVGGVSFVAHTFGIFLVNHDSYLCIWRWGGRILEEAYRVIRGGGASLTTNDEFLVTAFDVLRKETKYTTDFLRHLPYHGFTGGRLTCPANEPTQDRQRLILFKNNKKCLICC